MTDTPTPIRRVSMGATSCHESLSGSYLHGRQNKHTHNQWAPDKRLINIEPCPAEVFTPSLNFSTLPQVVVSQPGTEMDLICIVRH